MGNLITPTPFLNEEKLTPAFPPIEASTIASKVVGILIQFIPRLYKLATNPVISEVTPPPIEIKVSSRVILFLNKNSNIF